MRRASHSRERGTSPPKKDSGEEVANRESRDIEYYYTDFRKTLY